MIFNLRLLPTVVGIAVGLGMAEPFLLGQQYVAIAGGASEAIAKSTKKSRVRRPPPPLKDANDSRGFPGRREAAVNRACPSAGTKLVALAPRFGQADGAEVVWGQTMQAHPTLWFLVAGVDRSVPLEFFLQDRKDEVIYQAVVAAPVKDGVIGVKIPQSQRPLALNQHYRWTLKATFACGESAPEIRYVDGWVQRIGLSVGLGVVGSAERGIWYDAVTSLAERRLREPNNVELGQDWRELLGVVDLAGVAGQPVLEVKMVE